MVNRFQNCVGREGRAIVYLFYLCLCKHNKIILHQLELSNFHKSKKGDLDFVMVELNEAAKKVSPLVIQRKLFFLISDRTTSGGTFLQFPLVSSTKYIPF